MLGAFLFFLRSVSVFLELNIYKCPPIEIPNKFISGTGLDRLRLWYYGSCLNAVPNLLTICAFYKVAAATTLQHLFFYFETMRFIFAWLDWVIQCGADVVT